MKSAIKFEWKQVEGRVAPRFDVSLGYNGDYTIVQSSPRRFLLSYSTKSLCVEHVGVYATLDKAKRAARRHFNSSFIG
jgi:hypothetical protein